MAARAHARDERSHIASWSDDLERPLRRFAREYQKYRDSLRVVRAMVPRSCDSKEVKMLCSIQEIVYIWMDEKCEEATRESRSTGHIEIRRSELPTEIGQFDLRFCPLWMSEEYASLSEAPVAIVVEHALELVNVEAFYEAVMRMANGLQAEAYRDAAMRLGDSFGLVSRLEWKRKVALRVKCVRGLLVLERGIFGTNCQRSHRISSLEEVAQTFEQEAGVLGLVEVLRNSRELLDQVQNRAKVPSRKRVSTETGVKAVFFKDKMAIHFPVPLFEALVGFVHAYAPTDYLCPLERV